MEQNEMKTTNESIMDASKLDQSLFQELPDHSSLHDQAFETKPVSYLHDCFNRFAKNKASIVAAIIILLIALFAIIVPLASPKAHVSTKDFPDGYEDTNFKYALPYNPMFKGSGFWDGTEVKSYSEVDYLIKKNDDSNHKPFVKLESTTVTQVGAIKTTTYNVRIDSYAVGCKIVKVTPEVYNNLVAYDKEQSEGSKILHPLVDSETYIARYKEELQNDGASENIINNIIDQVQMYYNQNPNCYYEVKAKRSGKEKPYTWNQNNIVPVTEGKGHDRTFKEIYQKDADGNYVYGKIENGEYTIRVDYFDYFTYKNGFKPYYFFGANDQGKDIFLRLAEGTRFSLLLGIVISAINFIIGLIWGAISGYYGGTVDLVMERITDIIANIPSIIILTICSIQFVNNLELKNALGEAGIIVLSFLIAFVYSGWTGVASTTRMQFYRFKGQEYVLASRTLGAKDSRLIFRHILPNAIGTLVTSSVLMIPSVIFSESSLSYLGIINFSTSGLSSIGTLLNEGQSAGLKTYPHVLLFPCIIISLLMICFNLFGNGLRDAFNTSLKGADE